MHPWCVLQVATPRVVHRGTVPLQSPEEKQEISWLQAAGVVCAAQVIVGVPVQVVPLQVQPVIAWHEAIVNPVKQDGVPVQVEV